MKLDMEHQTKNLIDIEQLKEKYILQTNKIDKLKKEIKKSFNLTWIFISLSFLYSCIIILLHHFLAN